jgi:hypothetical protein
MTTSTETCANCGQRESSHPITRYDNEKGKIWVECKKFVPLAQNHSQEPKENPSKKRYSPDTQTPLSEKKVQITKLCKGYNEQDVAEAVKKLKEKIKGEDNEKFLDYFIDKIFGSELTK